MATLNSVTLLLGSNLGDRQAYLRMAVNHINELVGKVVKSSSVYESDPWGLFTQPLFLNQALMLQTPASAWEVLEQVKVIEMKAGRTREVHWDARTLDIDILYYNREVFESPELTIPHPLIADRRFTLLPLVELDADFIHPKLRRTHYKLLQDCADIVKVWKVDWQNI